MDNTIEELWNRLYTQLHNFICRRLPSCEDADDICQEVFVRIHLNLDKIRDLERLDAWIYQVARNSIADFYRSRRQLEPLTDYPVEDEFDEEDAAIQEIPYIREIVQSLPEPYRQALILYEYEGLSQQDMAERLGISLSGAKSRLQRARQKVKDVMLACCHYELDRRGHIIDVCENCCCCEGKTVSL